MENILLIVRKKLEIVAKRRPDNFNFTRFFQLII